jgi:hypothetical protein
MLPAPRSPDGRTIREDHRSPPSSGRHEHHAGYDQRTDQFGELGKPYGTAPGFYLLVGPDWDGDVPTASRP